MHLILLISAAATLTLAAGGCSPADPNPPANTGGATSGGASSGGASSGGASAGSANAGTAGSVVTSYAKNVQPILMAKCGQCHGGTSQGQHDIATKYEDAKRPVQSLQYDECWTNYLMDNAIPKTIGECSMLLGRVGKMPISEGCDAPTPPNPSVCLTAAEKDVLTAWVAGGMAP